MLFKCIHTLNTYTHILFICICMRVYIYNDACLHLTAFDVMSLIFLVHLNIIHVGTYILLIYIILGGSFGTLM